MIKVSCLDICFLHDLTTSFDSDPDMELDSEGWSWDHVVQQLVVSLLRQQVHQHQQKFCQQTNPPGYGELHHDQTTRQVDARSDSLPAGMLQRWTEPSGGRCSGTGAGP